MAEVHYKIVLMGNACVGKSSFLQRLRLGEDFDPDKTDLVTVGVDYWNYTCTVGSTTIKVSLFDTAGHDKYRSRCANYNYIHHADCVILMYAVDDAHSLFDLSDWREMVSQYTRQDITWALVGNKSDLCLEISMDAVEQKRDEFNIRHLSFAISARTGENVEYTFATIVDSVHNNNTVFHKPPEGTDTKLQLVEVKPRQSLC